MAIIPGDAGTYVCNQFLGDGTRVYLNLEAKIMAFNREQGALLWEAAVADEIQHNICPGCFQLFGDKIVTLSAGGDLEAWNVETGARVWNISLEETPRQIVNFGGNPGVLDRVEGEVAFNVFNAADGSLADRFTPACPNEPFPDSPQVVGIYDKILGLPNG
jgi:outer membrane protein assembly factor BamB